MRLVYEPGTLSQPNWSQDLYVKLTRMRQGSRRFVASRRGYSHVQIYPLLLASSELNLKEIMLRAIEVLGATSDTRK